MKTDLSVACVPQYETGETLVDGVFKPEHMAFRESMRRFIQREIEPHYRDWEKAPEGYPRELWMKAAAAGFLGTAIPEAYGGPGGDILYTLISGEEMGNTVAGAGMGALFDNDLMTITLLEHGTEEQKRRYCPEIVAGKRHWALALTEPEAGSDIMAMRSRARSDGTDYLISGQKIYISGGMRANLFLFVARTDEDLQRGAKSMTMFLIDNPDAPGFTRRRMDTLGERAGNVAELFLDNVRVPRSAIIGEPGEALRVNLAQLMPYDRMMISTRAFAATRCAFDLTVDFVKNRKLFGQTLFDFQNTKFKLAEMKANIVVGEAFRESLLKKMVRNELDVATSSVAKLWFTENEYKTVSECFQLHGGHAYMNDSAISRLFTFARLETIYAGTSEIHKQTIARYL
jgi:long-chain-acyl-CoA dehydrogenase